MSNAKQNDVMKSKANILDRIEALRASKENANTRRVFMTLSGVIFRTEQDAKDYYGDRFESAIANGILNKIVIDEDGNTVTTWN